MKLDGLALKLNSADLEINADRRDVALGIGIVGETEEQAGLADTGVTDEEQLEEVVVLAGVHLYELDPGTTSEEIRMAKAG